MPLSSTPTLSPATVCHFPLLLPLCHSLVPFSFSLYGCHSHLLKLTSASFPLLLKYLPSPSILLEQNPNSLTQCEDCPGLRPQHCSPSPHSPGFNVACFSFLSSSLGSPILHLCSCPCLCQRFSHFPRLFPALLVIMPILKGSTQIPPWRIVGPPILRVTAPYYASVTTLTAALPLVLVLCIYSPHHHFCTYNIINGKER